MLLLIFAFLHPFIDNFNCSDQKHRNTLFHIKTNLCKGSQIIMHKLFVHEFSIWTYCIFSKKEVALKVLIWERYKDVLSNTYFRLPPSLHSSWTWMGQKDTSRHVPQFNTVQSDLESKTHLVVWTPYNLQHFCRFLSWTTLDR